MRCLSRMLISNVHKTIIVINFIDTRFSRNVFEAVQKLAARVLNPIKHSSFFKHDIIWVSERPVPKHNKRVYFEKGLASKETEVLRWWRVETNVSFISRVDHLATERFER